MSEIPDLNISNIFGDDADDDRNVPQGVEVPTEKVPGATEIEDVTGGTILIDFLTFSHDFDDLDREFLDELLKPSIAKKGVMVPILIDRDHNILAGRHRACACIELGIKTIPYVMAEGDFDDVCFLENVIRRDLPYSVKREIVNRKKEMLISQGKKGTQKQLADHFGISQQAISKILQPTKKDDASRKRKERSKVMSAQVENLPYGMTVRVFDGKIVLTVTIAETDPELFLDSCRDKLDGLPDISENIKNAQDQI